jgi:hypothetical protein
MKKIFTLAMMSAFALGAMAQSNGFYHVQNTLTKRYMVLVDNKGKADTSGNVDMQACNTCLDLDEVSVHPGSVFYIENVSGSAYEVKAQGSSLAALTSNRLQVQITSGTEGYELWGSYSGITVYIGDAENKKARTDDQYETWSYIKEAGSKNRYWKLHAIDNSTHYIGIKPDCQAAGAYWGSIKAGFSFKLYSSGMEAYYVDAVDNSSFSLKKWDNDVIPATMPVVIKCSSNDPAKNIIKPVTDSASEPSTNWLEGTYFDNTQKNHENYVAYDSNSMRTLGEDGGKLVFKQASSGDLTDGKYCVHNKAYLMKVPSAAASTLVEGSGTGIQSVMNNSKKADDAIYTLNGVRLQKGVTPRPGVYIQNGKKIVVK